MSDINRGNGHRAPRIKYGVNSSGNPGAVPVKTGNQNKKGLDARLKTSGMTEQRNWIPPYQVPRVKHGAG